MCNITNSYNTSAVVEQPFKPWTASTALSVAIFFIAFCFNAFVLFLFARNANLRTPFTTYIINLLVVNLFTQMFQQRLTIVSHLYSFPYLGHTFCSAFLYGSYVIHSIVYNAHFLITLNRIWAVTSPVTYRHHNSQTSAVICCVFCWVFIHIIMLSGVVSNELYYTVPLERGCFIEKSPLRTWFIVEQLLLYNIALSFLILAYPVICFAQIRRLIRRNRLVEISRGSENNITGIQLAIRGSSGPPQVLERARVVGSRKRSLNAFLLLTVLTFSNCAFLMPLTVAYNISTFVLARDEWTRFSVPQLYVITTLLFYVQAVVDPILFTLALADLCSAALLSLYSANEISFK